MSYIGNTPGVSSQRLVTSYIATAGQTSFVATGGYVRGYLDVYLNGVKLSYVDDFTATDGVNVVLSVSASAGDTVELVAYIPRGLSDGYTKAEADALLATKLALSGGTVNGTINVNGLLYNGAPTGRQVASNAWSDMSSGGGGQGVFAGNAYIDYTSGQFKYSNSHGSIGAIGIRFNSPTWNYGSLFGSNTIIATANSAFTPLDALTWDTFGRILTPNQPIFHVTGMPSSYVSPSNGTASKITWNNAGVNRAGWYDGSGKFTAPVTGIYKFYAFGLLLGSGAANLTLEIRKNGATVISGRSKTTIESFLSVEGSISMSSGDYVEIYGWSDGGNSGTMYNGFCGWGGELVG